MYKRQDKDNLDNYQPEMVLISYGENGHGAYPRNGGSTRINGFPVGNPFRDDSTHEIENASLDKDGSPTTFTAVFHSFPPIRDDDLTSGSRIYFDDIVRFMYKRDMIRLAGASIYENSCRVAEDVINNPNNNACTGADNESDCENFALEVSDLCL